jgi:hypothetical protein
MDSACAVSGEPRAVVDAIRLPPVPDACELCARNAPLTRHHLIPRALHDKGYVQRRFDRRERITATLWVCRPCHDKIHLLFSEKELALTYNSREALLLDERLRAFVEWLARKPAGLNPKH